MTVTDRPGFKKFGQFLIKVGSQYGDIYINRLIPHHTTISTNTIKIANNYRNSVFENILPFVQNNSCAMTTDMWSDMYIKLHYITITFHYINKNVCLKKHVPHTGQ